MLLSSASKRQSVSLYKTNQSVLRVKGLPLLPRLSRVAREGIFVDSFLLSLTDASIMALSASMVGLSLREELN